MEGSRFNVFFLSWDIVDDYSIVEEVDQQSETSRSALSSVNPPTKREREEDDVEMAGSDMRDGSVHDQSIATSAIDNNSEAHDVPVNIESLGDGEMPISDEINMDF